MDEGEASGAETTVTEATADNAGADTTGAETEPVPLENTFGFPIWGPLAALSTADANWVPKDPSGKAADCTKLGWLIAAATSNPMYQPIP